MSDLLPKRVNFQLLLPKNYDFRVLIRLQQIIVILRSVKFLSLKTIILFVIRTVTNRDWIFGRGRDNLIMAGIGHSGIMAGAGILGRKCKCDAHLVTSEQQILNTNK